MATSHDVVSSVSLFQSRAYPNLGLYMADCIKSKQIFIDTFWLWNGGGVSTPSKTNVT